MIEKIKTWFAVNKTLGIALAGLVGLFLLKKMMKPARRRRRARKPATVSRGAKRYLRKTRRTYTKGGKAKKPWQIKGSLAAKRHMARLRKMK